MDVGSQSLLFPMIQSVAEAELAVSATRYLPEGIGGVSGTQRGNQFECVKNYFEKVHNETCVIVQIETMHALEQVEAIATVDGVDSVFFGPADLAAGMVKPAQIRDAQLWEPIGNTAKQEKLLVNLPERLVMDAAKVIAV